MRWTTRLKSFVAMCRWLGAASCHRPVARPCRSTRSDGHSNRMLLLPAETSPERLTAAELTPRKTWPHSRPACNAQAKDSLRRRAIPRPRQPELRRSPRIFVWSTRTSGRKPYAHWLSTRPSGQTRCGRGSMRRQRRRMLSTSCGGTGWECPASNERPEAHPTH